MSDYKENENELNKTDLTGLDEDELNESVSNEDGLEEDNSRTIFLHSFEDEDRDEEDEDEDLEEEPSSGSWLKITIIILAIVAFSGIVIANRFLSKKIYTGYDIVAESSKALPADAHYAYDYGKIFCYNSEGISIYNEKGEIEWNAALNMTNPKITVNNGYAVVADIGGRNILVVNHKSVPASQVSYKMLRDILLTDISEQGEIAVLMQDENGYDIQLLNLFDKNESLKAEIKTYSKDDGFALSLAMSKDGSKLVTEYVKTENNEIKSTLTFYNFDKVGENSNADRIVGVFPYENTIFPKLKFADNNTVCAYGDNKIVCFIAKKEPEILWEKNIAGKIERIAEDSSGFALLVDENDIMLENENVSSGSAVSNEYIDGDYLNKDTKGKTVLYSFNYGGSRGFLEEVDINAKGMNYKAGEVILYSDNNCIIFDANGNKKFKNKFNEGIVSLTPTNSKTKYFAVIGKKLKVVRLSE